MVFTVVSLFSGAGGFDISFKMLGYDILFANDIDHDACETYRANVGDITEGDIHDIQPPDRKADVLVGGFPCPSFSICGYGKGFDDERGQLFFQIPRFIAGVKPSVFVLENVANILDKDNGSIKFRILAELSALGYDVYTVTVKCEQYGVSQQRHRVLFIGTRLDLAENFKYIPLTNQRLTPSWYWLDGIDDYTEYGISDQTLQWLVNEKRPNIPFNKKYARNKYRIDPNGICGTLTTDIGHSMGIFHSTYDRKLNIDEYSRLQGFPPFYKWKGDFGSIGRQIGNAFPPLVSFNVAFHLKQFLDTATFLDARRKPVNQVISMNRL